MERTVKQVRSFTPQFQTRESSEELRIEGYFAVFNSNYDMGYGMSESIAPGAFSNTLAGDIRALINHDTTLVLGRTKAHTLELKQDERGLWGSIVINPNDSDSMNLYQRVKRGDVDQCSIGFFIVSEETDFREDGSVHWTITEIELFEVSCCTFPAYEETAIAARTAEKKDLEQRYGEAWKTQMKERLKNASCVNASQEDQ